MTVYEPYHSSLDIYHDGLVCLHHLLYQVMDVPPSPAVPENLPWHHQHQLSAPKREDEIPGRKRLESQESHEGQEL